MTQDKEPYNYENVPSWVGNKLQYIVMRAILQKVQWLGLPKHYMLDMAQDFILIGEHNITKFVYCIRDCGTDFFAPVSIDGVSQANRFESHCQVFDADGSCNWFTFDVTDVRDRDNYNEPQLRECTQQQARECLSSLYREKWDNAKIW